MEDIEDLVAGGGGGGAPPGFRLPLTAVGVKPKRSRNRPDKLGDEKRSLYKDSVASHCSNIPGTQTIYIKTFGCSHNQSDSEYMAGQLSAFGYCLSDNPEEADLWLINTCTVKSPSQSAMETLITKCKSAKRPLVVAGCVPQGSRDLKELEGVSIVGVQQIDRVVEVVEETLKGHEVRLLHRKRLPTLDLPKVRRNKFIEILPINVGCLGACTYCKTKHARGHLGSYTIDSLVGRVKTVIADGVREIWLSSEDTGAYGRDIGVNLPTLLKAIVTVLPPDESTMLRVGMTNPPFILEHLKEIAEVLRHPCVYSFLHVPVQSGSDAVLTAMNREYTVSEFRTVVDTLTELVPGMQIATDIICGFPGTPAARMKKIPSTVVKQRSRELTSVFEAFTPYSGMEGRLERIWITEIATDGIHLVGHTKGYIQVLVVAPDSMLGTSAIVKITSVGRWSVFGEGIETLNSVNQETASTNRTCLDEASAFSTTCDACSCSKEADPCACGAQSCEEKTVEEAPLSRNDTWEDKTTTLIGWLLRKRRNRVKKRQESVIVSGHNSSQELVSERRVEWGGIDRALLGGMLVSLLTIAALVMHLGARVST
ncbi:threonylcarbamoyladenosine tRNA methylthiotransferase isoform X2 [Rhodamnia argentea]|uniref:Threonylcarbamoyladenosine tRNA methylthiotransferase n=1 Tax=Rhodamnia argentea TaxID=178133 RepID=A0A8B8NTZ2_9MYRT|nr:threonylcarbamoyladenosine tRNA methylthiotransferase isoform X2 [Rhodamnia argentea]